MTSLNRPQLTIEYLPSGDGASLVSCFGPASELRLPERLDGRPLREILPYAFSSPQAAKEHLPEGALPAAVRTDGGPSFADETRFLGGDFLREAYLPEGLRSIGEYAFYNCVNLSRLGLHGGAVRVGNGALMNCCSLNRLDFSASPADGTCLFDLLAEISGEIRVSFRGAGDFSVFLFPEFYEESVENGPARIFEHRILGAGYRYRQCFEGDVLKTEEYDAQFPVCVPQMEPETALGIVLNRLRHPSGLREPARAEYLAYLAENARAAAVRMVRTDSPEGIAFLAGLGVLSRESIAAAVEEASKAGRAECLGVLLNERHRLFPAGGKTFEL